MKVEHAEEVPGDLGGLLAVDFRRRLADDVAPDDQPLILWPHHADQTGADAAGIAAQLDDPAGQGLSGCPGVFEVTWSEDARETFSYGPPRVPGQPHVIWRQIGTFAGQPNGAVHLTAEEVGEGVAEGLFRAAAGIEDAISRPDGDGGR